jgi:hypothetical protein
VIEAVSEIFLRYPPSNQSDLGARAAQIGLMAGDLFDVDPMHIRRAGTELARERLFLPKASEIMLKVETYRAEKRVASYAKSSNYRSRWAPSAAPEVKQHTPLTPSAAREILIEERIPQGHYLWSFASVDATYDTDGMP